MSAGTVRIGVLTYDLQHATEDLLFRLDQALPNAKVTAYPCFFHPHQTQARIDQLPSQLVARPLGLDADPKTKIGTEGLTRSFNLRAAWQMVMKSDVVVLHGLQGGTALLATALTTLLNKPLVAVNHSLGIEMEQGRRWWIKRLKKLLLTRCDQHICQTPSAQATLSAVYGIDPERMTFAPFEGGSAAFKALALNRVERRVATRRQWGLADDETPLFLFVGNVIPLKGPDVLIQALALLKDRPFRAVLVGQEDAGFGPQGTRQHYIDLARRLGLEHKVSVLPPVDREGLANLYSAADVFVLPTRKDCLPKVFIEASVFGLPIITTTAPGSVGLLPREGVSGWVIPIDDVAALAQALTAACEPTLRARYANAIKIDGDRFCDPQAEVDGFLTAISRTRPFQSIQCNNTP